DAPFASPAPPAAAAAAVPPALVRAGLARDLAVAWVLTAEPRYRDAAALELHALTRALGGDEERPLFADREGFAIAATLDAASALGDSIAQTRALAALDTLLKRVYARGFGVRHAMAGTVHGLLQDQVQVAAASVAAYNATGKPRYLEVAKNLADVLERDFADPQGGYFDAAVPDASAPALADRTKQVLDDLLPGANAAAARVLLRLAAVTGDAGYRRRARATLEAFAGGGGGCRGGSTDPGLPPSGEPGRPHALPHVAVSDRRQPLQEPPRPALGAAGVAGGGGPGPRSARRGGRAGAGRAAGTRRARAANAVAGEARGVSPQAR